VIRITAFQYHLSEMLWPERVVNSSFGNDGEDNGLKQTFLTPGVIFGRFKVHGRVMAVGAGFEIAVTHYLLTG